MSVRHPSQNILLTAPIPRLFLMQAMPMALVMLMSGLLNIVDAIFLGQFVGADALAAVSIVFPALMLTIALSSLVSGGMSSLFARYRGAGAHDKAAMVFGQAHSLSLVIALMLIAAFFAFGDAALDRLNGGRPAVAGPAYAYLMIIVCGTPVQFVLGLHADAWRNEGRTGLVALASVGVTAANIVLNYLLIVRLGLGVAGSAWGTVLAQAVGLAVLVGLRLHAPGSTRWAARRQYATAADWRSILTLGAPLSLSFIGVALVSTTVIATLQMTGNTGFAVDVAAYGIVTRVLSFTFLPLMAISLTTQSIVGNNFGAGLRARSNGVLRFAIGTAFFYCLAVEAAMFGAHRIIGHAFTDDLMIVARAGMILRVMTSLYIVTGPVLVLALYFQAIGQPGRTALLTLVKPFLLSPALVVAVGVAFGTGSLWFAFPATDATVAVLAILIAFASLKRRSAEASPG